MERKAGSFVTLQVQEQQINGTMRPKLPKRHIAEDRAEAHAGKKSQA